jgi:hypothetical protein
MDIAQARLSSKEEQMKKYALVGIAGISVIAVVAIAALMAASKPVQYTWKAVILDSSTNLTAATYNDSDEFANVSVFIREYSSGGTKQYTPVFTLEVLGPTLVGMMGMVVGSYGLDTNLVCCGFPECQNANLPCNLPTCWESFLNGPKIGYQHMSFMHEGARYPTKEEADFASMAIGEKRVMRLHFLIQGQEVMGSCDQCNPYNYHQVEGDAHGDTTDGSGLDIYLTRENQDTWKVVVNTNFDRRTYDTWPTTFNWNDDKLWESYCECISEKVGKRTVQTKYIQKSSWVRAHLGYEMEFIRTAK